MSCGDPSPGLYCVHRTSEHGVGRHDPQPEEPAAAEPAAAEPAAAQRPDVAKWHHDGIVYEELGPQG